MIYDELHTPFRWYNDIGKQNRFKAQCERNCTFPLITQCDRLLPFQIKTPSIFPLTIWEIKDLEGNTVVDISWCIDDNIQVKTIEGSDYIIYGGHDLCTMALGCGEYYAVLSDGIDTYYSEVFTVEHFSDTAFEQSLFHLHTPFRWYDSQTKQNRYLNQCERNCNFVLISANDALLPFMFRRETIPNPIESWTMQSIEGDCEIPLDTTLINIVTIGDYDYIYYNGDAQNNLVCGTFESIINDGVNTFYSELFKIVDDITEAAFLMQENNAKILQETGKGILLE